jgi:hypothetical protein
LFFRQCSYSTTLRGWPCQPRIPAGRPPCPPLPFLPTATSSFLTTTPPVPLSLFNNKSLPSSSNLPDLRRQQVA